MTIIKVHLQIREIKTIDLWIVFIIKRLTTRIARSCFSIAMDVHEWSLSALRNTRRRDYVMRCIVAATEADELAELNHPIDSTCRRRCVHHAPRLITSSLAPPSQLETCVHISAYSRCKSLCLLFCLSTSILLFLFLSFSLTEEDVINDIWNYVTSRSWRRRSHTSSP